MGKHIKRISTAVFLFAFIFFLVGCNKNTLNNATITIEQSSYTYTGQEIKPEFVVKVGDKTLTSAEFSVEFSNNINVGIAQIKITGKGNYKGTKTTTFEITPANLNGIGVSDVNVTYNGIARSISVTGLLTGDVVEYRTSQQDAWSSTNPSFIDAGVYTVYYKVSRANYTAVSSSATITINKAVLNASIQSKSVKFNGQAQSLDLPQLPTGSLVEYSTEVDGTYSAVVPAYTNLGTYRIYYKITHKNYNEFKGDALLTIFAAQQTNVVATPVETLYDGQTHSIEVSGYAQGSIVTYSTSESGTFSQSNPQFSNAGNYTVYFKIELANYETFTGQSYVKIEKVTPLVTTLPVAQEVTALQAIGDSTLTGGAVSPTISGSFVWDEPTSKMLNFSDSQTTLFKVKFVPTDTLNYNEVSLSVKITVNQIQNQAYGFVNGSYILTTNINLYNIPLQYSSENNVRGTISFKSNQTLEAGTNDYDWVFIPNDNNYETYEDTISLTVRDDIQLIGIEIDPYYSQPHSICASNRIYGGVPVIAYFEDSNGAIIEERIYEYEVIYQNGGDYALVGDQYATINYLGYTTTLALEVEPLYFDANEQVFGYYGKLIYTEGYEVSLDDFGIYEELKIYATIDDIQITPLGSTITITFNFENPELIYTPDSIFTVVYSFELFMPNALTKIVVDDEEIIVETGEKSGTLLVNDQTIEILLEFDSALYDTYVFFGAEKVQIQNGAAKTIPLGQISEIALVVYEKGSKIKVIDNYYFSVYQEPYVKAALYSNLRGYEYEFNLVLDGKNVTGYEATLYEDYITDLYFELKQGYTYELTMDDKPFDINNLFLGYNKIVLNIYSGNTLVATRNIFINYLLYSSRVRMVDEGDNYNRIASTMIYRDKFRFAFDGELVGPFNFYHEEGFLLELYTLDGTVVDIDNIEKFPAGKSEYRIKIYYENGSQVVSVWVDLFIYNNSVNIRDYIEEITLKLEMMPTIYFSFAGTYANETPIHKYYSIEDIYNNLDIRTTGWFDDEDYILEHEVFEDYIIFTILTSEHEYVYEFVVEIFYYGEVSSDTSIWYSINAVDISDNYKLLEDDEIIKISIYSEVVFFPEDDYANITISSDDEDIYPEDNYVQFYTIGIYILTIEVLASDKVTIKTYTITVVVSDIVNLFEIEFATGEKIAVRPGYEDMNFGDFIFESFYFDFENSVVHVNIAKLLQANKLENYLANGKLTINILSEKDILELLVINDLPLQSLTGVEVELFEDYGYVFFNISFRTIYLGTNVIIHAQVLFAEAENVLTITANKDGQETTKSFAMFENLLTGDYDEGILYEYHVYMQNQVEEIFEDGTYYALLDIELADGYNLYDFNFETLTPGQYVPVYVETYYEEEIGHTYHEVVLIISVYTAEEIQDILSSIGEDDVYFEVVSSIMKVIRLILN